jgi:hypothetical protein
MAIPEHAAWFANTCGATEGAPMDAEYAELLPGLQEELKRIFEYARKDDRTNPEISVIEKDSPSRVWGRPLL